MSEKPEDRSEGWKTDPNDSSRLRYWDGGAWTAGSRFADKESEGLSEERGASNPPETASKTTGLEGGVVGKQGQSPPPKRSFWDWLNGEEAGENERRKAERRQQAQAAQFAKSRSGKDANPSRGGGIDRLIAQSRSGESAKPPEIGSAGTSDQPPSGTKPENSSRGWKQDPDDPTRLRFWDGGAWTGIYHAAPELPPEEAETLLNAPRGQVEAAKTPIHAPSPSQTVQTGSAKPEDRTRGWKQDPDDQTRLRFWNGVTWTQRYGRRADGSSGKAQPASAIPGQDRAEQDWRQSPSKEKDSFMGWFSALEGWAKAALIGASVVAVLVAVVVMSSVISPSWESMCRDDAEKELAARGWNDDSMVDGLTDVCVSQANSFEDEGVWSRDEIKLKLGLGD